MTHHLTIEYGEDLLLSTAMGKREFEEEARFLLSAKLYELGKLSSAQAAKLSGMGRVEFLLSLQRIGISMANLQPEDAVAEAGFSRSG